MKKKNGRKMLRQYILLTDAAFFNASMQIKRYQINFIKEFIGAHNIKERTFSVKNTV